MILTEGTVADSTRARPLTEDFPTEYLLADKGYDTNAIQRSYAWTMDGWLR